MALALADLAADLRDFQGLIRHRAEGKQALLRGLAGNLKEMLLVSGVLLAGVATLVPEPGTGALVALGIAAIGPVARRHDYEVDGPASRSITVYEQNVGGKKQAFDLRELPVEILGYPRACPPTVRLVGKEAAHFPPRTKSAGKR